MKTNYTAFHPVDIVGGYRNLMGRGIPEMVSCVLRFSRHRRKGNDRGMGNPRYFLFYAMIHIAFVGGIMKYASKIIMTAFVLMLCLLTAGCSKRSTANTAESYYLYEDVFKAAGFNKRIQVMHMAADGETFETPEELIAASKTSEVKEVVAWLKGENKCESYNLSGDDSTKVGNVVYTYRYNSAGLRIARVGGGLYLEYLYEDGKIKKINRYDGEKKTADSSPVMVTEFKYDADGTNTVISITDIKNPSKNYEMHLTYDEKGKLVRLDYDSPEGSSSGYTVLTYNKKGLVTSSAIFTADDRLSVFTEYTYE